jgi:hypothetical protein
MALEVPGDGQRAVGLTLDAQRESLYPEADLLGVERGEGGPEVAELLCQHAGAERRAAEGIPEDEPVIVGVRLGEGGELALDLAPVEVASVYDGASHRGPMSADPLREGLDHHGGAVLGRTVEVGRREGVVHEDRHVDRAGRGDEGGHVGDVEPRVADGLGIPELGVLVGCGEEPLDVVVLHEARVDAEALEGVEEDVPRPAVEGVRGHDVVAGPRDVEDREDLGRMARGDRDGRRAMLERGDARGDGVGRGVGQAAVDVARHLERELSGGIGRVLELEGGGLVDGKGRGPGDGIGGKPRVHLKGVEVGFGVVGEAGIELEGHGVSSLVWRRPCPPSRRGRGLSLCCLGKTDVLRPDSGTTSSLRQREPGLAHHPTGNAGVCRLGHHDVLYHS